MKKQIRKRNSSSSLFSVRSKSGLIYQKKLTEIIKRKAYFSDADFSRFISPEKLKCRYFALSKVDNISDIPIENSLIQTDSLNTVVFIDI